MREGKELMDFMFKRNTPAKLNITEEMMRRYGLPTKYHGLTLDTWLAEGGDPEVVREIALWAENMIKIRDKGEMVGLILGGPWGTGKTGLAVYLAQAYLAKTFFESKKGGRVGPWNEEGGYYETPTDFQVRFVDMADLRTMIQSAESFNQRDHQARWAELNDCGFLIIDDISDRLFDVDANGELQGAEGVYLMRLIKNRLMNKKLTVLTTNMPKAELQIALGKGGRSVLRESCYMLGVSKVVIRKDNTTRKPWD